MLIASVPPTSLAAQTTGESKGKGKGGGMGLVEDDTASTFKTAATEEDFLTARRREWYVPSLHGGDVNTSIVGVAVFCRRDSFSSLFMIFRHHNCPYFFVKVSIFYTFYMISKFPLSLFPDSTVDCCILLARILTNGPNVDLLSRTAGGSGCFRCCRMCHACLSLSFVWVLFLLPCFCFSAGS
jgi:hypothetical protein